MRVCVLVDGDADLDPSPFLQGYDWEMFSLRAPVQDRIQALVEGGGFDVFLNLARGYELDQIEPGGPGYLGIEVVQALENLGAAFTGADSRSFDPSPAEQRAVAEAQGMAFARGGEAESVEEAVGLAKDLTYPLMVKRPRSSRGTGIPESARAGTLDELKAEVVRALNNFGGARIEEFLPGAEFNVLVVEDQERSDEPAVYPPSELVFLPQQEFRRTDVTWASDLSFDFRRVEEPEQVDGLQDAARRMYRALGLTGYALAEIRAATDGRLVMLGMQTNPAIMSPGRETGPADYIILFDDEGWGGFLRRIFGAALARQKRLTKTAKSSPTA